MPDVFPLFKEKEYGDGCKKAKYIEKWQKKTAIKELY
jgi:hypothetical protein